MSTEINIVRIDDDVEIQFESDNGGGVIPLTTKEAEELGEKLIRVATE